MFDFALINNFLGKGLLYAFFLIINQSKNNINILFRDFVS